MGSKPSASWPGTAVFQEPQGLSVCAVVTARWLSFLPCRFPLPQLPPTPPQFCVSTCRNRPLYAATAARVPLETCFSRFGRLSGGPLGMTGRREPFSPVPCLRDAGVAARRLTRGLGPLSRLLEALLSRPVGSYRVPAPRPRSGPPLTCTVLLLSWKVDSPDARDSSLQAGVGDEAEWGSEDEDECSGRSPSGRPRARRALCSRTSGVGGPSPTPCVVLAWTVLSSERGSLSSAGKAECPPPLR